jgi:hypothetical protein
MCTLQGLTAMLIPSLTTIVHSLPRARTINGYLPRHMCVYTPWMENCRTAAFDAVEAVLKRNVKQYDDKVAAMKSKGVYLMNKAYNGRCLDFSRFSDDVSGQAKASRDCHNDPNYRFHFSNGGQIRGALRLPTTQTLKRRISSDSDLLLETLAL